MTEEPEVLSDYFKGPEVKRTEQYSKFIPGRPASEPAGRRWAPHVVSVRHSWPGRWAIKVDGKEKTWTHSCRVGMEVARRWVKDLATPERHCLLVRYSARGRRLTVKEFK